MTTPPGDPEPTTHEYRIFFTATASTSVTVTAENYDEAVELAAQNIDGQLCHQCARDVEMGDEWASDDYAYYRDGEFVNEPHPDMGGPS